MMEKSVRVYSKIASVAKLEIILAFICILMPLFLRLADAPNNDWRDSISAYVDMENRHIFGMFLTAGALLFIYNGVLYFSKKIQKIETLALPTGRWYNIILGLSLIGVVVFKYTGPTKVYHYICAAIFFLGSIYIMAFVKEKKHPKLGVVLSAISSVSLLLHFIIPKEVTLFCAEWIALIAIGIYYIFETNKGF